MRMFTVLSLSPQLVFPARTLINKMASASTRHKENMAKVLGRILAELFKDWPEEVF
jgi:hypothetical protein